jgi:hypothetical protein
MEENVELNASEEVMVEEVVTETIIAEQVVVEEIIVKQYAHVVDGIVVNVSLRSDSTQLKENELIIEIPKDIPAGIGWDYVDGTFIDNRELNQEIIS